MGINKEQMLIDALQQTKNNTTININCTESMSDVQANKLSALWFVMFSVDSQLPHFNLQSIPQRPINTKKL